jgi:hypothetical protein
MKIKPNFEPSVYAFVIVLCLITLLLVVCSSDKFSDIKVVYQMF